MLRKITWSLCAIVLVAVVGSALWWSRQRQRQVPAATFIPDNAAAVFRVTGACRLPDLLSGAVSRPRHASLRRVIDTLARAGMVDSTTVTVALRLEGKGSARLLYVLDRAALLHRGSLAAFLERCFPGDAHPARAFDGHELRVLAVDGHEVHHAVAGTTVLLSDSGLLLEDALARADREEDTSRYGDACKYFSTAAGLNVFLGAACFAGVLPPGLTAAEEIAWGALDGYLAPWGASFNGFMHPGEGTRAFAAVLRGQRAGSTRLDEVLPTDVKAASILRLSDARRYLDDLQAYRLHAGIDDKVKKREREHDYLFGAGVAEEWQELSRGEIAKGVTGIDAAGREEGVIVVHLKSGSKGQDLLEKMIEHHALQANTSPDSARHLYRMEQKQVVYYDMPAADFASITWGEIIGGMPARYAFVQENYLVLASSRGDVQRFARDYFRRSSLRDVPWYKRARERLGVNHNWMHVAEGTPSAERAACVSSWGYQWSGEEGMLYTSIVAVTGEAGERQPTARVAWQTRLDADVAMKPAIVKNHVTGERELIVQDRANTLYLVTDAGLVAWKLPLDAPVNSEIYQVDYYKNGKLQYLFSTPTRLYLVDRNGAYLPRYPLPLRGRCEVGITLFDYENNRDYRVAAPADDRNLYLFGLDGNPTTGWETPRGDNPVASRLHHFRVGEKDYLVFADRSRLYMLDRRGRHRVKVDHLFDLPPRVTLHASRRGGKPVVLFADARQDVWWVDFEGHVGSWKGGGDGKPFHVNVADLDADGRDEWIFAAGETLTVRDDQGRLLHETRHAGATLAYPYIYRFSARDARVGTLDEAGGKLLLLKDGKASDGFPLTGTTPFSIAFHPGGGDDAGAGFYLFAGGEGGYLLKYRVRQ
jgi:hypothetical protein